MKDLSKFNAPKKTKANIQQESKKGNPSKKKKLLIMAIICLLGIAITSKLINKHLKKVKTETEKSNIELQAKNADTTHKDSDQKPEFSSKTPNNKMVFTFYDNLKQESVVVNVEPQAQRAQYKYTYIYQVASFRNMNETTYYNQKLEKVGLKPEFKRVGDWIRMYIGPYDSKRAMAPDIIKLQKIGLNGGFPREVSRTKIEPKKDDVNSKNQPQSNDKQEGA